MKQEEILQFIDLTSLNVDDNDQSIELLCKKAIDKNVAGVCTYPNYIHVSKKILSNTKIKVVSVAGCFPSSQSHIDIKASEVKYAYAQGADEIDIVISVGKFLEGKHDDVLKEIFTLKKAAKKAVLKCIIETGALKTRENIILASNLAIRGGADFIKTSTGKISPAATIDASAYILECIKDYYNSTGKKTGFKVAGGISTYPEAMQYIDLVKTILGEDWLTPTHFRIGASKLVNSL